jgi:hypothetical protein
MVLSDPTLLATLEVPTDASNAESAWQFNAPLGVAQRPECPPGIVCRPGGDYFTAAWVQATGNAGVLADSVERAKSAPVYVQQGDRGRLAGFCQLETAAERQVLRMRDTVGLTDLGSTTAILSNAITSSLAISTSIPLTVQVAGVATLSPSQLQSLAWTLRYTSTTTANLGACDTLKETVQQAFSLQPPLADVPLRVLVDLNAATNLEVSSVASDGSVDVATLSRSVDIGTVDIGTGVTGGLYAIAGTIQHDTNCPGSYVMGRVINTGGGPVAGIQVNLRDQWGNQAYTASKSGATDYGLFDFPIASGSPHELYLTVMDGSGNPISATFTIFHKMGDAGDAPCHHVILQGG